MLTIGSDCRIADLNKELAEGTPSKARIMVAPELWPATVILLGLPPKAATLFLKNCKALTTSLSARLVFPLGAKKPSYKSMRKPQILS